VIFLDGAATLGTAMLDPTGQATFTTSTLAVGTHPIRVAFPGSANFTSVTSATLSQVILPVATAIQSVVTLTSSINPSAPNQPVTFTATVSAPGTFPIVPTGTVMFLDGTAPIGTATVNPATGIATFITSTLATGSHPITASYSGTNGTTVILPNPPNLPKPPGAHLIETAPTPSGFRVSGPAPHATTVQVGTFNRAAAIPTPMIAAPQPRATSSAPTILPSTSAVLTQVVTAQLGAQAPGFALTVSPDPVTIGVGDTAILLVNVRAASGFSQPVALTCTGLPTESTCTFIQPLIPSGGGSTTLQVAVSAPHNCGSNTPYFVSSAGHPPMTGTIAAIAFPALFGSGFLMAGLRRRRKMLIGTIFMLALTLCGLAFGGIGLSGCGNCTDLGTKPGVYTFTVVGTAQSGSSNEVETQTIPMTVTIP